MRRLQKRYEEDEGFRGLVNGIETALRKHGFAPPEIRSAAALACLRHELSTGRRDFTLDMIVNEIFPELGLVVEEPSLPRQDLLSQRNKERAAVLENLAMAETPADALQILSTWRERRKAFDL